jgi:signal transduction histidine kinase
MDDEGSDHLHLSIHDDGRGFPDEAPTGVGITAMRERAAELGGWCKFESKPGAGTEVQVRLPL